MFPLPQAYHSIIDASMMVIRDTDLDCLTSYESLPPNFSLAQNMIAGAFAGIAVSPITFAFRGQPVIANRMLGTHSYVPN